MKKTVAAIFDTGTGALGSIFTIIMHLLPITSPIDTNAFITCSRACYVEDAHCATVTNITGNIINITSNWAFAISNDTTQDYCIPPDNTWADMIPCSWLFSSTQQHCKCVMEQAWKVNICSELICPILSYCIHKISLCSSYLLNHSTFQNLDICHIQTGLQRRLWRPHINSIKCFSPSIYLSHAHEVWSVLPLYFLLSLDNEFSPWNT